MQIMNNISSSLFKDVATKVGLLASAKRRAKQTKAVNEICLLAVS